MFLKFPFKETATFTDDEPVKNYYFKKSQKFPICFEDDERKIEVCGWGVKIKDKLERNILEFAYNISFPLLVKAVEKAKEVAKQNESN